MQKKIQKLTLDLQKEDLQKIAITRYLFLKAIPHYQLSADDRFFLSNYQFYLRNLFY